MDKNLHLIPTFHHDIAYLHPESWYTEFATRILDKAIEIMQENEEFTYTVEQAYFFDEYWKTHPEKREILKTLTEKGQLHFAPGFFAVPDMSMPSGESIYMQAYYGKKILQETVGYEPKTAFIADCWGHSASLPQILRQCGYDGYSFSRCMERDLDIENFRWKGIDGTEINTHWMSTSYGGLSFGETDKVNAEELKWENATADGIRSLMNQNENHCGADSQIMPVGGDMRMPSRSAPDIVKGMNLRGDLPLLKFSSFEEAFSEIDFENKPVYNGEFISSLKGSFATNIQIKIANRRMENMLYALEALTVLRDKNADLDPAWKITLKNQFHDILCGTICNESVVQVMEEYAEKEAELENIRKELANGDGKPFNTLNFKVCGIRESGDVSVKYCAEAFSEINERPLYGEKIELPCEYENIFYKAKINSQGYITSLIDKSIGRELVDDTSISFGSTQVQMDNGDNWVEFEYPWEYDPRSYSANLPDPYDRRNLASHAKVQLSAGAVLSAEAISFGEEGLIVKQHGCHSHWISKIPFTMTIIFAKDTPRIEYKFEFTNQTKRTRLRAAFPVKNSEVIRHQLPYAIIERGEGVQPAERFIDVTTASGDGIALLNKGLPANNCEDNIMMLTLFRSVAMEYKCDSDLSYNVDKSYTVEFAIVPHGKNADDTVWQNALQFNTPMICAE
ncbi:MAG: hypothetical protein IJF23_01515, partial [Clostridia bacterium]|nr:hypothetical protein [Clostridia bacterium]